MANWTKNDLKRQFDFVIGGELLCEALQVIRSDFRLMLKNVIAELVAEFLRLRVEIARNHRCIERPLVHRQREVMEHQRDFVGLRSLLLERRISPALGTFQVLKHDQRHLRAFRWTEQRGILSRGQ